MPPRKRIQKEKILEAALDIVREAGLEAINARAIAGRLGCSVQPIFSNFASMELLREEVISRAKALYHAYMEAGSREAIPYKGLGMAYIRFAREEPALFHILFMSNLNVAYDHYMQLDDVTSRMAICQGIDATGLSPEQMEKFHWNIFIFTHGIAALLADRTVMLTEEQISDMLTDMFRGQMALIREENEREKHY